MKGRGFRSGLVSALLLGISFVVLANRAFPQVGQPSLRIGAQAAVLMDAISGQVLFEQNPQIRMAPASFVKLLTLYMAFDALRDGHLKKEDLVLVSQKAWRMGEFYFCNHRSAEAYCRSGPGGTGGGKGRHSIG